MASEIMEIQTSITEESPSDVADIKNGGLDNDFKINDSFKTEIDIKEELIVETEPQSFQPAVPETSAAPKSIQQGSSANATITQGSSPLSLLKPTVQAIRVPPGISLTVVQDKTTVVPTDSKQASEKEPSTHFQPRLQVKQFPPPQPTPVSASAVKTSVQSTVHGIEIPSAVLEATSIYRRRVADNSLQLIQTQHSMPRIQVKQLPQQGVPQQQSPVSLSVMKRLVQSAIHGTSVPPANSQTAVQENSTIPQRGDLRQGPQTQQPEHLQPRIRVKKFSQMQPRIHSLLSHQLIPRQPRPISPVIRQPIFNQPLLVLRQRLNLSQQLMRLPPPASQQTGQGSQVSATASDQIRKAKVRRTAAPRQKRRVRGRWPKRAAEVLVKDNCAEEAHTVEVDPSMVLQVDEIKQETASETQPDNVPPLQPFSLFDTDGMTEENQQSSSKKSDEEEEPPVEIEDDPELAMTPGEKKPYTSREYCDMYLMYGQCKTNARLSARQYAIRYPKRRHPNQQMFINLDCMLRQTGQFQANSRTDSGRSSRNIDDADEDNDEEEIWDLINEDPRRSSRLRLPPSAYIDLHPYIYIKRQKLKPEENVQRVDFCQWLLEKHKEDSTFLNTVLWNSEAMFSRKGIFHFESAQYWTVENPNSIVQQGISERKGCNFWVGILNNSIVGPYTLPDRLNQEYYNHFIKDILPRLLEDIPFMIRGRICYQQDGSPVHRMKAIRKELPSIFPGGWFGKGDSIEWPPKSSDLNPVEFFLWNYLKSVVYKQSHETVEDLVASVRASIAAVTDDMLGQVRDSVLRRAQACILADGAHFEYLL